MSNEPIMQAGFSVGQMLVLLDEARKLLDEPTAGSPDWRNDAASWLAGHAEWLDAENARVAAQDGRRERLDRPEREQEPTYTSVEAERNRGYCDGSEAVTSARLNGRQYPPGKRTAQLGQVHIDVHAAWFFVGWHEGRMAALHRHYGYPRPEGSREETTDGRDE